MQRGSDYATCGRSIMKTKRDYETNEKRRNKRKKSGRVGEWENGNLESQRISHLILSHSPTLPLFFRLFRLFSFVSCLFCSVSAQNGTITIDAAKSGPRIPSSLYGIFFEEISHAGEGGLYAELIQNRGFEDANLPPACRLEDGFIVPPRTPHFWEQPKPSQWKMRWGVTNQWPAWTIILSRKSAAKLDLVDVKPNHQATLHRLQINIRKTN